MSTHTIRLVFLVFLVSLLSSCRLHKEATEDKLVTKRKKELSTREKEECLAIFLEANREKILGNFKKSGSLFAECIRKNPKDHASYYELASILTMDKEYEDALVLAKEATNLNPDNEWYQILLAELYNYKKLPSESAKIYEKLIRQHPLKTNYYYELAMFYIYDKKYNDAIKVYNRLESVIGINEELSNQKKSIFLYLNNIDKAAAEIQMLIKNYPSESRYKIMLADLYMDTGQKEKAFTIYQDVLNTDPKNNRINLALADYYKSIGKNELLIEQIILAFSNPDVNTDDKVEILLSYYTITDNGKNEDFLKQAYELLEILVNTHPNEAVAYSLYGDFLNRDNKKEEARKMFLKVIDLDNSRYLIWEQLLILESDLHNYKSMDSLSDLALELFPEQALLYLFNGFSNYILKNYEKAINAFNKGLVYAIFNEKLRAEFYMYLGDAYNHVKKFKDSDAAYENVLKIDPDNIMVLNNYSYYLSLRGEKLERAKTMAKKANELKPNISSYQDTYAWILYKLENYDEALLWIEKALANSGKNNPVIVEHYGDILFRLNRTNEARDQWLKAKEIGSLSEDIDKKIEKGLID